MASMMKKAMIYLGLGPDEEYEQYEEFAAAGPARSPGPQTRDVAPVEPDRPAVRPAIRPKVQENPLVHPQSTISSGTVRPITSDQVAAMSPEPEATPAVPGRRPVVASAVRTIGPASANPHAVSPTSFNDAQEIGDRFKTGQPVIVNLQAVDRDLRRRLVDFASGLCYAIAGKMERVADQVYLLTPADIEVPVEETRRHLD
jgi:cell division inhibitor SepF